MIKNLKKVVIFGAFCVASLIAKGEMTFTANGGQSVLYVHTGDEVIFEKKEMFDVKPSERHSKMNGYGTVLEDGRVWIAEPGIHVFEYSVGWPKKKNEDGQSGGWISKQVIVVVDGDKIRQDEFRHPGLSLTQDMIHRIKHNIKISDHPMAKSYKGLINSANKSVDWDPIDKIPENYVMIPRKTQFWDHFTGMLFTLAKAWVISGDQKYADACIRDINAWVTKNREITGGDYANLHFTNSNQGFIEAAELLKYYRDENGKGSGWKEEDIAKWDRYFKEVWVPMVKSWPGFGNSPFEGQNQNLNVIKSIMSTAIHGNFRPMYNLSTKRMFKNKNYYDNDMELHGMKGINYVVQSIGSLTHPGEIMELNRYGVGHPDMTHANMCVAPITLMANILWHQKGYTKYYNFYGWKAEIDSVPRLVSMVKFMADAGLVNEGLIKKGDWFVDDTSKIGVKYTRVPKGKKVVFGKEFTTMAMSQLYDHYQCELKGKWKLDTAYIRVASPYKVGKSLLFTGLHDDWETPDTANGAGTEFGGNVVAINENYKGLSKTFNHSNISVKMINGSNLKVSLASSGKDAVLKLYNLTGRELLSANIRGSKTVSLKGLNSGLFVVKIVDSESNSLIKKIMVK